MTDPQSPNSAVEDARLVVLAKGGDTAAFGTLAGRHQNRIYRFILKSVGTPAEARDLTQEALLQAYRCLASFNGTARFSTWITGIALNLARNHANRSPKCRFVEYNEENMASMTNTASDPYHHHRQKASLDALAAAIEALPTGMREYLVLIALDGNSYEEVSQLLDVPLGSVKSRMSRARQKLRQELTAQGFFD